MSLVLFVIAISIVHCKNEVHDARNSKDDREGDLILKNQRLEFNKHFWTKLCETNKFKKFYDCDSMTTEFYQVELSQHTFKANVIISIPFENGDINNIYLSKIYLSGDSVVPKKSELDNVVSLLPNYKKYIHYSEPRVISIHEADTLKNSLFSFFSKSIWNISNTKNKTQLLDPEIWRVRGRRRGQDLLLEKYSFNDSLYYSSIQSLLNLFEVTDYQYPLPMLNK